MTYNPNKPLAPGVEAISNEARETIFQKYSATPEGRAKLAMATFKPAENMMEKVTNDPLLVDHSDGIIADMERIQGMMTGEEDFDRRKFGSLLEGLQLLRDEIKGKVVFKRL
jgi:hypothetical protein